ncbi:MAG: hypothetical protein MI924_33985 [Chloroflexales bacterium]|nr:hypothetical protein [Chloroflexales bacterium]
MRSSSPIQVYVQDWPLVGRIGQWVVARDPGLLIIALLFILLLPLSTPRIVLSDEVQYYAYLRSIYFDGDLDFRNEYEHFAAIGSQHGDPAVFNALLRPDDANPNPVTGKLRNVAPVGSALLWAPGFVIADWGVRLANSLGAQVPADGYSRPYILAACYMSALYSLLGLLLTYRLARRFAGVFAATLATISVWLATPLVFHTYIAMPWSHATAFFLFALFLTLWLRHDTNSDPATPLIQRMAQRPLWIWASLGLVGGLMTITREQLGLLLIIPAVEGIVAYIQLLRARRWDGMGQLMLGHVSFLLALALALTPQLAAYQALNGQPGPSSTVESKLVWTSPNFFNTLIDPAHGAFLWSPVVFIGLLGLFWLGRRDLLLALLLGLGFVAQTYINGAFGTTWHLSGAFGFRRLIECTPIFVLGLAALAEWLRGRVGYWPLLLGALFLIYWNIGLIAQWTVVRPAEARKGLVWDDMIYYQFVEAPRQVFDKFYLLVFDRCRLVRNQTC